MACGRQLPLQIVWRGKGVVSQGFHGAPSNGCTSWAADWILLVPWTVPVLSWNREELKGREGHGGRHSCVGTVSVPPCQRSRGPEIMGQACPPGRQSLERTHNATSTSSTEINPKKAKEVCPASNLKTTPWFPLHVPGISVPLTRESACI